MSLLFISNVQKPIQINACEYETIENGIVKETSNVWVMFMFISTKNNNKPNCGALLFETV